MTSALFACPPATPQCDENGRCEPQPTGGGTGGGSEATDAGPLDAGVFTPGDTCANALPVDFGGGTKVTLSVDLAQATGQYEPRCGSPVGSGNDMVFALDLPQAQKLRVTATSTGANPQAPVLALMASPCTSEAMRQCSASTPTVLEVERVQAGTWFVLLDNYQAADVPGTYELEFELLPAPPQLPNDECATATQLTFTNDVATVTGTVVGADDTNAYGPPEVCTSTLHTSGDVFYRFTLTQPQQVVIEVSSSQFSPSMDLRSACAGEVLACSRGTTAIPAGSFSPNLPAGDYVVMVDMASEDRGEFTLKVTLSPPVIPPPNNCTAPETLVPGATVMFDASGDTADLAGLSCGFLRQHEAAYTFTLATPQVVSLVVTPMGPENPNIELRRTACNPGEVLDCESKSDPGPVSLQGRALPAGTYYVVIGFETDFASAGLSFDVQPMPAPPAHDTCATAQQVVFNGDIAMTTVNMVGSTASYTPSGACSALSGGDVVYRVTVPAGDTLFVNTTTGGRLPHVIFTTTTCASAAQVVCDFERTAYENTTGGAQTVFVIIKASKPGREGTVNVKFTMN